MENSYFDKLFRDKLEHLEDLDKAGSWELLQHRMAADPDLSTSGETPDPIDEIIKTKLEGNTPSYDPGFWAMMEDKIDADVDLNPQMDDVVFDGIAYENLNDLETPYNPSHWELMAKRIQEEFSLRHRLYRYKVAEISLMLLAIFTLLQFLPIEKTSIAKNKNIDKTEIQHKIQQAYSSIKPELNSSESATKNSQTIADDNTTISNTVITSPVGPIVVTSLLAEAKTNATKPASKTALPDFSKLNNIGASATPIENVLALNQSVVNSSDTNNSTGTTSQEDQVLTTTEDKHPFSTTLLDINSSEMDLLTFDDSKNLPRCILCERRKPVYIRVGMVIASNLNYTMTPFDEKFEEQSYATLSAGYTGGFSVGVQKGRLEIGTAIHYSSIKYSPKQNVEYTGSLQRGLVGEGLKSAQLNILSIPLNINYTYAYAGKWQLYALAGGSANMAVVNHFDTKKFSVGSSRGSLDPRIPDPHPEPSPSYNGVFEGGSLQDNLYFTVNLGLGAERYLTPRWSVFVQPVYQHSVFANGIGPKSDRFNTFSIFAGAKATLK